MKLRMEGINKKFFGNPVLQDVNLSVAEGSVEALTGENGAGKSTLMKILSGAISPDSGHIYLNGKLIDGLTPIRARDLGISIVHQELSLVPHMTVAQNMYLGKETTSKAGLFMNHKKMVKLSQELLNENGFEIDASEIVANLSIADRQLAEIAKNIIVPPEVLILDEPTSALSTAEIQRLFEIIESFKKRDVAIIYISHKLDEIVALADGATVLKDGKNNGRMAKEEISEDRIVQMMVGRDIKHFVVKEPRASKEVVVQVEGLSSSDGAEDVSFELYKGEILGIAGLVGSGRTELLETIFGLRPKTKGTIHVHGHQEDICNPTQAIRLGIAFVTEDRKGNGLILPMSVQKNISLVNLPEYSRLVINDQKRKQVTNRFVESLRIKVRDPGQPVKDLSGGNQQKVVLAKWLLSEPSILLIDEPTRGIDVGAKLEIYETLQKLSNQGLSIIMVSSELPEIIALADRVLVMSNGTAVGTLERSQFAEESIMKLATSGVKDVV